MTVTPKQDQLALQEETDETLPSFTVAAVLIILADYDRQKHWLLRWFGDFHDIGKIKEILKDKDQQATLTDKEQTDILLAFSHSAIRSYTITFWQWVECVLIWFFGSRAKKINLTSFSNENNQCNQEFITFNRLINLCFGDQSDSSAFDNGGYLQKLAWATARLDQFNLPITLAHKVYRFENEKLNQLISIFAMLKECELLEDKNITDVIECSNFKGLAEFIKFLCARNNLLDQEMLNCLISHPGHLNAACLEALVSQIETNKNKGICDLDFAVFKSEFLALLPIHACFREVVNQISSGLYPSICSDDELKVADASNFSLPSSKRPTNNCFALFNKQQGLRLSTSPTSIADYSLSEKKHPFIPSA